MEIIKESGVQYIPLVWWVVFRWRISYFEGIQNARENGN